MANIMDDLIWITEAEYQAQQMNALQIGPRDAKPLP